MVAHATSQVHLHSLDAALCLPDCSAASGNHVSDKLSWEGMTSLLKQHTNRTFTDLVQHCTHLTEELHDCTTVNQ